MQKEKENKKPLSYRLMRWWANRHNNLHDFTLLHAGGWLVGALLMSVVAFMAFWADWEVLYGIEFNNSHNPTHSHYLSLTLASIIQALILISGGMAVKLWINGKLSNGNHRIQFWIHSVLFFGGMAATLYLSFNTYSSSKAKAHNTHHNTIQHHENTKNEVLGEVEGDIVELIEKYEGDKAHIKETFGAAIHAKELPYLTEIKRKETAHKNGKLSKGMLEEKRAKYQNRASEASAATKTEQATALLNLHTTHNASLQRLENKKDSLEKGLGLAKSSSLEELGLGIEVAAQSTQGRNVLLNLISFILLVGLMYFFRGANEGKTPSNNNKPTSTTPNPNNPILQGINGGMKEGAEVTTPKESTTPQTPRNAVVTPPTPNKKVKGGTVEANEEDVWDVLDNGSVVVLYVGANGDSWKNKSYVKGQIKNRITKAAKATAKDRKESNLKWAKMWERKLGVILREEENV